jgi:hypothetical protein
MCEIGLGQFLPGHAHELPVLRRRWGRGDTHSCVVTVGRHNPAGFPVQAVESLPCLDGANASPELLPEHSDAALHGPQVLQAVDSNRRLTDLGFICQ